MYCHFLGGGPSEGLFSAIAKYKKLLPPLNSMCRVPKIVSFGLELRVDGGEGDRAGFILVHAL
jgi:hypothetical protein